MDDKIKKIAWNCSLITIQAIITLILILFWKSIIGQIVETVLTVLNFTALVQIIFEIKDQCNDE